MKWKSYSMPVNKFFPKYVSLFCMVMILMAACSPAIQETPIPEASPAPQTEEQLPATTQTPAPSKTQISTPNKTRTPIPSKTQTPTPSKTQTPTPSKTQTVSAENQLSQEGPWILLSTESGLWALNQDGSGLTQLTKERVIVSGNLGTAISQEDPYVAFVTASDEASLQGLTLHLLKLPEGDLQTITPLTSAKTEPKPNASVCDPNFEAARAVTIGSGLQWSPDGTQLAFIGAQQGDTADLYVYSLADGAITRLSDEHAQAYDIHWSGDSRNIVYFSASCFGTGAGFIMEGVWAYRFNDSRRIKLYKPSDESYAEEFIAWLFNENNAFYVATRSGCPLRDLRLVDLDTQNVISIYEGCFEDVAVGPTGMLAVLTSRDFSDQPGLYLYTELPTIMQPAYVPQENGRNIVSVDNLLIVKSNMPSGEEIRSFDWSGKPGRYQGKGDFPTFSPDGNTWVWNENGGFYFSGINIGAPVTLSDQKVQHLLWYEDVSQAGTIRQRLLFFDDSGNLYLASDPDYLPVLLADNLKPLSSPIKIFR